ncbi:hypothetical protein J2855_004474 [Agrobacterium tumefaciens]|nr:hypothetical protein [Agrobacterium tumefaciens]MBP2519982.1 hypothetical protein [Agrobacterium tumefaciens]MBP2578652.1 hypothetical protein [Agrobacterium tumefaciens]MBP2596945.1 hypothetical protein [Agrobacterium tumefaciens]
MLQTFPTPIPKRFTLHGHQCRAKDVAGMLTNLFFDLITFWAQNCLRLAGERVRIEAR